MTGTSAESPLHFPAQTASRHAAIGRLLVVVGGFLVHAFRRLLRRYRAEGANPLFDPFQAREICVRRDIVGNAEDETLARAEVSEGLVEVSLKTGIVHRIVEESH